MRRFVRLSCTLLLGGVLFSVAPIHLRAQFAPVVPQNDGEVEGLEDAFDELEDTQDQDDPRPAAVPLVLAQFGQKIFLYENGAWQPFQHTTDAFDAELDVYQVGERDFFFVEGFINERDAVDVRYFDFDLKNRKLVKPPGGFALMRRLQSGIELRADERDASEAIYEYRGVKRTGVRQKHERPFKQFRYLPDGSVHYQFQPFQIGKAGPTVIYYKTPAKNAKPKKLVSKEWIFYPSFINNGTHIVYLHRESFDPEGDGVFNVECVDVKTGAVRSLGKFSVPYYSNYTEYLFRVWEHSPYVAVDDWKTLRLVDALTGRTVKTIPSGDWKSLPGLYSGSIGLRLGRHLVMKNGETGVIRFHNVPDLGVDFELKMPVDPNFASKIVAVGDQ